MTAAVDQLDLRRFQDAIALRLGLHFEDTKIDYLADVLRERMAARGVTRFAAYEARLADREELGALADRLTVTETYFFRYGDHFRAFSDVVIPDRARALCGRRIRVLSAACASGEEAYSLAILGREQAGRASWNASIHGFDVSPNMIERARRARYTTWSLRETRPDTRDRYFRPVGRDFRLAEDIADTVSFEERNLVDDDPTFWYPGAFDVVFCRNVLMYFRHDIMAAVVSRIHRSLSPGGFLFLGHAETLRGVSQDFHLRHTHDTFYYQRKELGESATPAPAEHWLSPRPKSTALLPSTPYLGDLSWVDEIQRASNRVTEITSARGVSEVDSPRPSKPSSSTDLRPAVELLRQERFVEAMDLLQALPASSQNDPDALLLRAALLTNSGKLVDAEVICHQILGLDELCAGAHYLLALCREHAGDRTAALHHDQAAIYLDAGFAMPHLHLGLLARRERDSEQARAELSLALALLSREDSSRILLFGGGFSREALLALCRAELQASESGSW
jgi:chemotaxis protein methyltransferase CheR